MDLSRRDLLIGAAGVAAGPWRDFERFAPASASEKVVAGGPGDFMIVRHLRLQGSNRLIGRELARIARSRHSTQLQKIDKGVDRARRDYLAKRYPAMLERAKGVADEYGLAWQALGLDPVGLTYNGLDGPACSTVYYPPSKTQNGHATLSRNYDFTTMSLAEMFGMPPSRSSRPFTGDPYVIEMYPSKGYPSLYICSYDLLTGCIDGMNSKGLAVALLADDVSRDAKPSRSARIGLGEIEITRFLLDECADVQDAKAALKDIEQYYTFIPCHYIIGDSAGRSFVWERAIPSGARRVVDGAGKPQVVTNHLLSDFPAPDKLKESHPGGSFNRYCRLRDEISKNSGKLGVDEIKRINGLVQAGPPQAQVGQKPGRTLWYSLYDLSARRLEVDFYLGEDPKAAKGQRRSGYVRFGLSS